MKSWRSTLSGIASALGILAAAVAFLADAPPWAIAAGAICTALAQAINGYVGRDDRVTSADAGATTKTEKGRVSEALVLIQAKQTTEQAPASVADAIAQSTPAPLPGAP